MDVVSLFIPYDADFLRASLNKLADLGGRKGFQEIAARVASLAIPVIAFFHVLMYAAQGQLIDALKLSAFTLISPVWSVAALFRGAKVWQTWKEVFVPANNFAVFQRLFEQLLIKDYPIGSIVNKRGNLYFAPERIAGPLDPFTASVLSYLLIKGHQKFQLAEITPEEFDVLLNAIQKMVGNIEGKSLEAVNLKILLHHYLKLRETGENIFLKNSEIVSLGSLIDCLFFEQPWQKDVVRTPFFDKETVKELFGDRFGENFVKEIFKYYPLKGEVVSEKDVVALLIGIAANLTLENAKEIFGTEDEQQLILKIARTREILYQFADQHKIIPEASWEKQYCKDFDCLKTMCLLLRVAGQEYPFGPFQELFATYEYLARHLIYYLFDPSFSNFNLNGACDTRFKEGTLVILRGLSDEPRLYAIKTVIQDGGLNGVFLVPAYPKENDKGFVIFRGTSDFASISRDFGVWERNSLELWPEGPGSASFYKRRKIILEKWAEQRKEFPQITEWNFLGHSLGGSDVARVVATIANKNENNLEGVKKVNVLTYNAPHVEGWTNRELQQGMEKLIDHCQFSVTHLEGEGDLCDKFGISRVAEFKKSKPRNLQTESIRFAQPKAKSLYECHTTPWLIPQADATPLTRQDQERLAVCMLRLA